MYAPRPLGSVAPVTSLASACSTAASAASAASSHAYVREATLPTAGMRSPPQSQRGSTVDARRRRSAEECMAGVLEDVAQIMIAHHQQAAAAPDITASPQPAASPSSDGSVSSESMPPMPTMQSSRNETTEDDSLPLQLSGAWSQEGQLAPSPEAVVPTGRGAAVPPGFPVLPAGDKEPVFAPELYRLMQEQQARAQGEGVGVVPKHTPPATGTPRRISNPSPDAPAMHATGHEVVPLPAGAAGDASLAAVMGAGGFGEYPSTCTTCAAPRELVAAASQPRGPRVGGPMAAHGGGGVLDAYMRAMAGAYGQLQDVEAMQRVLAESQLLLNPTSRGASLCSTCGRDAWGRGGSPPGSDATRAPPVVGYPVAAPAPRARARDGSPTGLPRQRTLMQSSRIASYIPQVPPVETVRSLLGGVGAGPSKHAVAGASVSMPSILSATSLPLPSATRQITTPMSPVQPQHSPPPAVPPAPSPPSPGDSAHDDFAVLARRLIHELRTQMPSPPPPPRLVPPPPAAPAAGQPYALPQLQPQMWY